MTSKHTPGPWHIDPITAHVNELSTGMPLCAMQWPSDERSEETTKANARLIAAAPELLKAIKRFDVEGLELDGDEEIDITMTAEDLRILRSAIAKAKGEKP